MAEAIPEALRSREDLAEAERCPREESFTEMYRALGNRQAQETIRLASPNRTHCQFLRESPDACVRLPDKYGEMAGKICPHNPYERKELLPIFEAAEDYATLAEEALCVRDMVRTNTLPRTDKLDAEVFFAARIVAEWDRAERLKIQAQMMFGSPTEEDNG